MRLISRIPTRQLKISANKATGIRENLREGVFSLILEYSLPSCDRPKMMALEEGAKLIKFVASDKRLSAISVGEGVEGDKAYELIDVCREMRKASRKAEMMVSIAGHGLDEAQFSKALTDVSELKVETLTLTCGAALEGHTIPPSDGASSESFQYMDSAHMLYLARKQWSTALVGTRINPYKYCLEDTYLQYYRMMKNISSGADFLVTQPGWDMKKLHEHQWYQRHRSLDIPSIARLMFVHTEDVLNILDYKYPGLVMSRELGALIQREFTDEREGAMLALRRLGLQAAGCRLLGFSGVSLCGVHDLASAELIVDEVVKALEEFHSYDEWLEAWDAFNHGIELAPAGNRYYVFQNLLNPEMLDYDSEAILLAEDTLDDPGSADRIRYKLAKQLNMQNPSGPLKQVLRKLLTGFKPGADRRANKATMLGAEQCPKGLVEGVCEESRPDGTCEFGHETCFFHSVLKLEQWQKHLDVLEEPYADK